MNRSHERRWVIVTLDGRYVTLGRRSDPSEEEIRQAEASLRAQGLEGWLAVMQGNPHTGDIPYLMEVRPLAGARGPFETVAAACQLRIAEARKTL